jgi:tetratricopeptide (TPR) repeat protein
VIPLVASAQPEAERPWARGVPKDRQATALELFREGNTRLRDSLYKAARERYVEALKVWDHPAIHYNLALCLLNLDQPVEAYEHLRRALEYGAAPLDAEKLDQALRYKSLVEKQLTRLTLRCELEGAAVRVDGALAFTGPGRWEGMVRAGPHSVVASREGYVPFERAENLVGGAALELDVKLFRTEDLTEYRRLWPAPVPWVIAGAGVALVGGGVGLHLGARSDFEAWDRGIAACAASEATGCVPHPDLTALRARGDALQALAFTSYALGGAALVTGAVLVYVNRLQPFLRTVDSAKVSLAPMLGPGGGGAALLVSF